ncbi:MAG: hypothetical protein NXI12_09740 [Alphaproteobacteria bacterium]|nr:hypothetical protein [Alphaproteobacteria bacterium]
MMIRAASRLVPPLLTAAAIWALCLAESHADGHGALSADDPACQSPAEDASPSGAASPAPGCPDPLTPVRP